MLIAVNEIDDAVVERLFGVYAESMGDLSPAFPGEVEMRSEYRDFLKGFVAEPGKLVLVEEDDGTWESALRAIDCGGGRWFLEAVETAPASRRRGFGRCLLTDVSAFLRDLGAREIACCIYEGNEASMRLHEGCGFMATDEPPMSPWGELDEECVLWLLDLVRDQ